jgi:ankyrin repeat protein
MLHELARNGRLGIANASLSLWGRRRLEALHRAGAGKAEIVAALEKYIDTLNEEEAIANDEVDWHTDWRGRRLAMLAVATGDLATARILLDHGAVHLGHLDHHTLLAEAARHGHLQVAQLLIDRGADLHTTGSDGLTPREWAAREGREDVVNSLRQLEAEAGSDRLGMS